MTGPEDSRIGIDPENALRRSVGLLTGHFGPVGREVGGVAQSLEHAGLVGLAGDLEGGAMVDSRAY